MKWIRMNLVTIAVIAAGILTFYHFHDETRDLAKIWVNEYGYPMLFFLTFLADGLIQPVPPDLIVFGSGFGGANPIKAGLVAGLGSSCGGVLGYCIGRMINPWQFRRWFGSRLMKKGGALFRAYGPLTIAIAAVTPIPYSGACYLGGLYRMSLPVLFLVSLVSRIARFLIVGWLGALAP